MKNSINKAKIIILLSSISTSLLLSGCSTYNSSFSCSDARGLNCVSMSMVDQRIQSGEIEEVELSNCKGRNCAKERYKIKPNLKLKNIHEAVLISEEAADLEPVVIGDRLYVK